jgi:CHAT domain-containing protein/tetratricopeptide (TPR) repeat protein
VKGISSLTGLSLRAALLAFLGIWLTLLLAMHSTHAGRDLPELVVESENPFPVRPVLGTADSTHVAELTDRIDSLKADGKFAEALPLAREILELRRRLQPPADGVSWWETLEAERLVTDLEFFTTFTPEQRLELEEAGRLREQAEEAEKSSDIATLIESSERLVEIYRRLLGDTHLKVASALTWVGVANKMGGAYARAESLFYRVMEITLPQTGRWHPWIARAWSGIATGRMHQGDYAAAAASYRCAVTVYEACYGEEHPRVAQCLRDLAQALIWQGDYARAEPVLQKCLAITYRVFGDENIDVVRTLSIIGMFHKERVNYAKAEPYLVDALAMSRRLFEGPHDTVIAAVSNLAALYMDRGEYDKAEPLFREALSKMRELHGEGHPRLATGMNNLAVLLNRQKKYAEAVHLYEQVLEIIRKTLGEDHPYFAHTLANLSTATAALGELERADSLSSLALEKRRQLLGDEHPRVIQSHEMVSRIRLARGNFASAESLLVVACDLYERARTKAGGGMGKATFTRSPYPALAATRLAIGTTEGVWEAWERDRCRLLAEMIQGAVGRELTPELAAREDSLSKQLTEAEQAVSACERTARSDSSRSSLSELEDARMKLFGLQTEWSTLQAEIARRYPVREGVNLSLPEIQSTLDARTAMIGWVDREVRTGEYVSWGYVIRDRGPIFWAQVLDAEGEPQTESPFGSVREWRKMLADPWSPSTELDLAAQRLLDARVVPLLPALDGVASLIVVPSGAMQSVPLEALRDETGQWLSDRFALSYSPSATLHAWLSRQGERGAGRDLASRQALLLGDPPFNSDQLAAMEAEAGAGELLALAEIPDEATLRSALRGEEDALAAMPRLPATRAEVSALAEMVPGATLLVGPDASERRIFELSESMGLSRFALLHLATHALVDVEHPERSCLLLSRTDLTDPAEPRSEEQRSYDGLLTAYEIAREWKLDAELVTLSACETALGAQVGNEGVVGFVHTFLQAGARSLLVSLWKVEDLATSLLMLRFYHNWWEEDLSKAEALREAKAWLRSLTIEEVAQQRAALGLSRMTMRGAEEHRDTSLPTSEYRPFAHPNFWAGFVLFGEAG